VRVDAPFRPGELAEWREGCRTAAGAPGDKVIPRGLYAANESLAFLIELAALAALAWWGITTGSSRPVHVILGLRLPLIAVVIWALFAAPKSRIKTPLAGALAVKAIVFGARRQREPCLAGTPPEILPSVAERPDCGVAGTAGQAEAVRAVGENVHGVGHAIGCECRGVARFDGIAGPGSCLLQSVVGTVPT
jgi:Protein of unknown function (DUF2568)